MKINDKHLTAFVNSNAPIDKEGYMLKKGEVNKANQKRWFVLKGNILFYFENKGDREPIGVIILEGCTAVDAEDAMNGKTFTITFGRTYGGRTYVLTCDTNSETLAWVKAISCASYDYVKMLVQELQKQLEEVTLAERSKSFKGERRASPHYQIPVGLDAASLLATGEPRGATGGEAEGSPHDVDVADLLGLQDVPAGSSISFPPRRNPFDRKREGFSLGELDESHFEQTVQVPRIFPGLNDSQLREFEEMHRDFGKKMEGLIS